MAASNKQQATSRQATKKYLLFIPFAPSCLRLILLSCSSCNPENPDSDKRKTKERKD
ncbi:MAG: hypothetical protein LBL13_10905 [Bacteroidales bacterium]|nr:hypothetical protein [Bacteroidales bacterium]